MENVKDIYKDRKFSEGYPNLDRLSHEWFSNEVSNRPDASPRIERLFMYMGRLIDLSSKKNIAVLGCGPHPQEITILAKNGHTVVGIEPVQSFVETAQVFVGDSAKVICGAAEAIPLPNNSQDVVVFENVFEHVDSIPHSLEEIYRVLVPGGVVCITTSNCHRFSPVGRNGEFNVPFYNWFPRLVKESYIFHHLHYNPKLANYTERPAVHWFSFAELCSRGRDAGYAQFYSIVDLMQSTDESITKSRLRRAFLPLIQQSPLVRSLALTQAGGTIFMLKRK